MDAMQRLRQEVDDPIVNDLLKHMTKRMDTAANDFVERVLEVRGNASRRVIAVQMAMRFLHFAAATLQTVEAPEDVWAAMCKSVWAQRTLLEKENK